MTFLPRFQLPDDESPQPIGERYGLLTAAQGPFVLPPKALAGGITYYPTSCGFTRDYPIECGPDESPDESPDDSIKIFDEDTVNTLGDPFLLYSTIVCGSAGLGAMPQDAEARLRRRLELRFSNGAATGTEQGASLAFASSGAPELVVPDPTDITSVVSTLEQWLYSRRDMAVDGGGTSQGIGYGFRGYLHAPAGVAAWAMKEHLIEPDRDNPRIWKTAMGTVWVFGGGYSGALPGAAAPVGGVEGIYITGQTTVWKQDLPIEPPLREIFDRETNQRLALLERAYMVTWDCGIAAAGYDIGTVSP